MTTWVIEHIGVTASKLRPPNRSVTQRTEKNALVYTLQHEHNLPVLPSVVYTRSEKILYTARPQPTRLIPRDTLKNRSPERESRPTTPWLKETKIQNRKCNRHKPTTPSLRHHHKIASHGIPSRLSRRPIHQTTSVPSRRRSDFRFYSLRYRTASIRR